MFKSTIFRVVDNSGVLRLRCIYFKSTKSQRKIAEIGSYGLGSVTRIRRGFSKRSPKPFKRGNLVWFVLITRPIFSFRNDSAVAVRTNYASVVLINKRSRLPIAKRIQGIALRELRSKGFLRVLALSLLVI